MAEKTGIQTISIIILTAICTALATYVIPRIGDKVVTPERQVIDIGSVNDTLHFVTTTKEAKPRIVYTGSKFTLNGKTISTKKLIEAFNDEANKVQGLKDSLHYYKKAVNVLKKEYYRKRDSTHIYRSINEFIKEKYGLYYNVEEEEKEKGSYTFTRMNSGKIDSALVLHKLYGDRLRLNDDYWSVLTDKEYRKEQRRNN